MRIESKAPTRVDLAGGTLDIWPLYLFHPGAVTINAAVTRYASCVIETHPRGDERIRLVSRDTKREENFASFPAMVKGRRYHLPLLAEIAKFFEPQGGFTLTTDSEAPAGAGIGGSSAMAVAICAALDRFTAAGKSKVDWIHISRDAEGIVIKVPTGTQDHYPPAFGGAAAIELPPAASAALSCAWISANSSNDWCSATPASRGNRASTIGRSSKRTSTARRSASQSRTHRRSGASNARRPRTNGLERDRPLDARGVELPQTQPSDDFHQNRRSHHRRRAPEKAPFPERSVGQAAAAVW
jgi:hypothetical protein